ncbi:MAG TPA: hypothetical protein VFZ21_18860, partial [Gemmatimonadaceae bacterium]|nr:hypothetical protein [Gemmatimonadaceae bacterium]
MTGLAMQVPTRFRKVAGFVRWLRPRALGTIRGRLALGFGATIILVAAIALLAIGALRASNTGNAEALTAAEQEFEGTQRVITAALREVASGVQYLESGSVEDRERWEAMVTRAEAARVEAARVQTLTPEQRTRLEEVGNLQSAVEVSIAIAQAYRRIGEPGRAAPLVRQAFSGVEQMDRTLEQFRTASSVQRRGIAAALDQRLHRDEWLVIVLGIAAVVVAAIFGIGTSRAVTRPL